MARRVVTEVRSDSSSKRYRIALTDAGQWQCSCLGWTRHVPRRDCKHIRRVQLQHNWGQATVQRVVAAMAAPNATTADVQRAASRLPVSTLVRSFDEPTAPVTAAPTAWPNGTPQSAIDDLCDPLARLWLLELD